MFTIESLTMGADNARNLSGDKELIASYKWIAENPRPPICLATYADQPAMAARHRFITPVSVRVWMGRSASASTVYASVWLRNRRGEYSSGYGTAGGYGYHKESAAIEAAFRDAGVEFSKHWGGSGDTATAHAVAIVGRKLGYRAGGLI